MSTRESKILLSDESIEEKALVTLRIFLFRFNIKIAKVILRKYFYVLAIKITSNTPSLPQPNASSPQNHTPISAKFRYTSTVSLQNADTTVETTQLEKDFAPKIHLYYLL